MGLFGKSDKEKQAEQEAHEKARQRMIEAKRKREQEAKPAAAPRPAAPPAPAAAAAPTAASAEYVVKSGDSLSKIAKRLLGDGNRWREIYDANRATIGDNPDHIEVGARLRIPK